MSAPLGILHLTTFLQGGAGRAMSDLACAQHAAGHQVTLVTSETGAIGYGNYPEYLERLRAEGVTLYTCDSLFARDRTLNARVVALLRDRVDLDALDVVHAHAAVPAFIGTLVANAAPRVGIIQTQHGWGSRKTAGQAAFDVSMLRAVDAVVATSGATRDLLIRHGADRTSVSVIPCGLPAALPGGIPEDARRTLGPYRARGARLVGCVGTVNANKNQRLLVDALRPANDLDVVAVCIGEGSDALVEYARGIGMAGRLVSCGYRPQASRWLPLLDLLVVPSRTEGQGLAVLEAFRAGVPVVASRIPALAELIEDGRTGLLFERESAQDLAAAMRRALTLTGGERDAMLAAARARFTAGFTVEQMVARYEALYRAVIAERARVLSDRALGSRPPSTDRSIGG
jgi:glycosyltransferase involved in cell wall biosynthesis